MEAPVRSDTTTPIAEEQLAALREEIRRAGAVTARLRLIAGAAVSAPLLGWLGGALIGNRLANSLYLELPTWGATMAVNMTNGTAVVSISAAFIVAALGAAFPLAMGYRRQKRGLIGRQLVGLPGERVVQALLPLLSESGDARKIVEPLLRDLSLPTELTPAGTPAGSGQEVSGAATVQDGDEGPVSSTKGSPADQ